MADLKEEVARAHEAERILNSPIFSEAFDAYEAKLLSAWKATGAGQSQERETIWMAYQLCGKVRKHITAIVTTGKMASAQIEELNGQAAKH